jgi:hypothetical protein
MRALGALLEVFSSTAQKLPWNSAKCARVEYSVRLNVNYQFIVSSKRLIFRSPPLSLIGNRSAPGRDGPETRIRPHETRKAEMKYGTGKNKISRAATAVHAP